MRESIDIHASEVYSLDYNYNGGSISNFRYYLNIPIQFLQKKPLDDINIKKYLLRKLFIRNHFGYDLEKINIFLLPAIDNFDIYTEKYLFYLVDYVDKDDVEGEINLYNSAGILPLYQNAMVNDDVVYLLKEPRNSNNIKITENLVNKPIIFYNKHTNQIIDEKYIVDNEIINIFGNDVYRVYLNDKVNKIIEKNVVNASIGISYENFLHEKYLPVWIGIDFYDTSSDILLSFKLIFSYKYKISTIEII